MNKNIFDIPDDIQDKLVTVAAQFCFEHGIKVTSVSKLMTDTITIYQEYMNKVMKDVDK